MIPVLECWAKVVRERGILLESHAQNILLEIDDNFRPRRVVHRDFDVWIDAEVRKLAGLDVPFTNVSIGSDTSYPREQHYSLVYDRFIGHELFNYLVQVVTHFYQADEVRIRRRVAEAFHRFFPDSARFFPARTTYYYSKELLPDNEFRLVDTHQAPEWR